MICYSFLGYLLERVFARATKAPKQVRKCFLLLPLCPVYGLAMGVHLALLPAEGAGLLPLVLQGALVATGVEYLVHLFYDKVLGVRFWDYTGIQGNLGGRICPPFSAIWGLLTALAVLEVQPVLERCIPLVPDWVTYAVFLMLAADSALSIQLLRLYRDTELLSWREVSKRLIKES